MDGLMAASRSPEVSGFITQYYDIHAVVGCGLFVDGTYLSLARNQWGDKLSDAEILSDVRVPDGWVDECTIAGYPPLSPIVVVLYVNDPVAFANTYKPPRVLAPSNYLVVLEQSDVPEGLHDRRRHRPVIGGMSVGAVARHSSGTISCICEDGGGTKYALSCAHVLLAAGVAGVLQQGRSDGGASPADEIGSTVLGVPLSAPTGFAFGHPYNSVDVALVEFATAATAGASGDIRLAGRVSSTRSAASTSIGDDVCFVGKESDKRDATISMFVARIKVAIEGVVYNFGDVFEIRARRVLYIGRLARAGDSGALVHADGDAVGVLFAATAKRAYACFFEKALDELSSQHTSLGTLSLVDAPSQEEALAVIQGL